MVKKSPNALEDLLFRTFSLVVNIYSVCNGNRFIVLVEGCRYPVTILVVLVLYINALQLVVGAVESFLLF